MGKNITFFKTRNAVHALVFTQIAMILTRTTGNKSYTVERREFSTIVEFVKNSDSVFASVIAASN